MLLTCLVAVTLGAASTEEQGRFWREVAGLDEAQVAAAVAASGQTQVVPTREDNDVVIAGSARVHVSKETLVREIRDLRVLGGARVVAVGRFSEPARLEDLAGLDFDRQDLADLRKCRAGSCELMLGEAGMEVARSVDWGARDAFATAERRLKQLLVDAIEAYRLHGTMAVYVDNEIPENTAEELGKVLGDSPRPASEQALLRHALDFPKSSLEGSEDVLYWSKTRFQASVVSLHHLVIHREGEGREARYQVADKHIFDTHYFLGSMDVLTVTDDTPGGDACYVTRLNRTRIDPPRRFRGMLLRKIKSRMKEVMEQDLWLLKTRLEARAKEEPGR
jgi:hypothetical protein